MESGMGTRIRMDMEIDAAESPIKGSLRRVLKR
jgi:hypothetical protein